MQKFGELTTLKKSHDEYPSLKEMIKGLIGDHFHSVISLNARHLLIAMLKAFSKYWMLASLSLIKNLQLLNLICG